MSSGVGIIVSAGERVPRTVSLFLNLSYQDDMEYLDLDSSDEISPSRLIGFLDGKSAVLFLLSRNNPVAFFAAGVAFERNLAIAFVTDERLYLPVSLRMFPNFSLNFKGGNILPAISALHEIWPQFDYSAALDVLEEWLEPLLISSPEVPRFPLPELAEPKDAGVGALPSPPHREEEQGISYNELLERVGKTLSEARNVTFQEASSSHRGKVFDIVAWIRSNEQPLSLLHNPIAIDLKVSNRLYAKDIDALIHRAENQGIKSLVVLSAGSISDTSLRASIDRARGRGITLIVVDNLLDRLRESHDVTALISASIPLS